MGWTYLRRRPECLRTGGSGEFGDFCVLAQQDSTLDLFAEWIDLLDDLADAFVLCGRFFGRFFSTGHQVA